MYRDAYILYFLVLTLAGLSGCSKSSDKGPAKAAAAPDKIQGKAQVNLDDNTATDAAMNAGGPSVYLIDGLHRYRLFFNKPFEIAAGKEYAAEGVLAQKVIDDIGDPDQGKNGYPLESSCQRVVNMAWPGLAMDVMDLHVSTLRGRVKRYPARPVFLVTQIAQVTSKDKPDEEKKIPEVAVPADKQRALLIEGPSSLTRLFGILPERQFVAESSSAMEKFRSSTPAPSSARLCRGRSIVISRPSRAAIRSK
jgi:hypothetical protein